MKFVPLNQPAGIRANAALVLSRLQMDQGSLATLLPMLTKSPGADPSSLALLKELCFGCCRWYFQLDARLQGLLEKPLKKKDSDIHALLLIGLYQLEHLGMPDYACINETVNATVTLKKHWAKALVNGVLRQFQRQLAAGLSELATESGRYSHPQWLIDQLKRDWPDHWQTILSAGNLHAPMTLRVNLRQISRDHFLQQLCDAGIGAESGTLTDTAVYLAKPCTAEALPGFQEGWFSVQDEASQLLPALLKLTAGLNVLDACAAPGGKTCHILESEPQLNSLLALDIEARRLARVGDNLQRLRLNSNKVDVVGADATQLDWWDGNLFDRILLDAPCTATGIIRRQPDIKLLRQAPDVMRVAELQAALLDNLWQTLKSGGYLVYSTCSVLAQENHKQIISFLNRHPDALEQPIPAIWGYARDCGRQLLPTSEGADGFYFACLKKID